jgi:hypothetical protein
MTNKLLSTLAAKLNCRSWLRVEPDKIRRQSTKKSIGLALAVGLTASVASMHAAIIPCTDTTLATLIALGSGAGNGCTIDDKLYNNFNYTPGAGAPAATAVNAAVDENLATLLSGWTFTSATGSFNGNFVLGFTVTVVPGPPCPSAPCTITSTAEQMFPGTTPPGNQAIAVAYTAPAEPGVNLNNLTFGGNTGGSAFAGISTLTKTATTSGITAAQPIISWESDVHETPASAVPEPVTLMAMGTGLLALSFLCSRRRRNA